MEKLIISHGLVDNGIDILDNNVEKNIKRTISTV